MFEPIVQHPSGSPIRAPPPINISRGASPIRSNSPSKYQPFRFGSIMMNNSSDNLALPGSNSGSITSIHGGGSGSGGGGEASTPKASYRRGHRYKHSSVSMNMFQEPIKKAPKNVPKTYEVPKREQIAQSLSTSQKTKLCWAGFNMFLSFATYILGFQYGNVCLSTLSHLIMYDSIGNFLVVGVQIMTNFEIWKNSSLKYPFGLGRIEVLAGFGLSVSLLFVGIELCSHLLEEHVVDLVVGIGHASEEVHSHHIHEHNGEQMNPILYELFLALVIFVTLYSSRVLLGDTSVSKGTIPEQPVVKKPYARRLSSLTLEEPKKTNINTHIKKYNILSTSTSILTLTYSLFSMIYPLAHGTEYVEIVNQLSTFLLSVSVLITASTLIKKLSNILLLGKPFKGLDHQIIKNVMSLDVFKSSYKIQELLISKVNHKIFIIILKVKMVGASEEDESKLRFYASKIIRNLMFKAIKNH
ncbi:unnamed protein product [Ambrosiozyma monospora]|uniref:Unnamed protein product n=1 Tax=Ambrosiozyma monospora TaxID=43982 RepID=A0A9W6SXY1_AMBMO|nr:unnamed protein product [Ambrosiozyma monospora]